MAKIAFVSRRNYGTYNQDSYVEGFSNALTRMGNIVHCFLSNYLSEKFIVKQLIKLNPDIIIAFNNECMNEKVIKKTSALIFLSASDVITFWKNIDLITKYPDRYYILHNSEDTYNEAIERFKNLPKEKNIMFGHTTDLKKRNIEQDIEISFVGSMGDWCKASSQYFLRNEKNPKININDIKEQYTTDVKKLIENPLYEIPKEPFSWNSAISYKEAVIFNATANKRFKILQALEEFKLKIFSIPSSILNVALYDINLLEAFDFTQSVTLYDNENTYNRSKVSLNLPHGIVSYGFSWRVPEIMASNACLLTDYRPNLERMMKPYIKFPMYTSPMEAKELAKKMIKDEIYRKELVLASQKMIEENCRFEPKIRRLSELCNIKMDMEGTSQGICEKHFINNMNRVCQFLPQNSFIKEKRIFLKNEIRYKLWAHLTQKLIEKGIIN